MPRTCVFVLVVLLLIPALASGSPRQASADPETVIVRNDSMTLHGLLWRPRGRGPFPAILFNHGSGRTREELERFGPYEEQAGILGPVFTRHGFVFLFLFRRGVGLSADQGTSSVDLMNAEFAAHGQDGRNTVQLRLLETTEMSDAVAGLTFLRALPEVDPHDVAIVGHSFGGSLTVLLAEHDPTLRAAIVFSGGGYSWDGSRELRERLLAAIDHAAMPVFFIHAANDYSVVLGKALAAELRRQGKPHRLKIYPPTGHTADEGHAFLYLRVTSWEPDVFPFLDKYMRR
jgi:carboxymethylenebutenolidase